MAEVEDDFGDEEEDEEEEELVRPKSIYDDEAIVKYQMAVAAAARPSARDEFTTAEAARTIMANRAYDDLTTSASSFYVDTHVRREDQVKPEKPEREWWEVWAARSPLYRHDYQPDPSEFANCGGIVPVVQNVDIMVSLGCSIDLTQVARKLPNCEYDPRKRSGVILRLRNPKATGTLFKSGNLRCMGARSEFLALCAARKFARKVTRLGMYKIHFRKFRVTNIMATADVGFPLTSLGDFAAEFDGDGALYDTEIFCGVRYQLTDPKVTVQIFASGKITFLGAPSRDAINRAFRYIYPRVLKYRPTTAPLPSAVPAPAPGFGPDTVKWEVTEVDSEGADAYAGTSFAPPPPLEAMGANVKVEGVEVKSESML